MNPNEPATAFEQKVETVFKTCVKVFFGAFVIFLSIALTFICIKENFS